MKALHEENRNPYYEVRSKEEVIEYLRREGFMND